MSLLPRSSDTEAIVGIQFGVFSPDEIRRRSVCEVVNPSTAEGKLGGLFDPRMGVLENGKTCRSCGQNNHHCPGHFGHFELARPVYFTQFFELVRKILRCVCFKCGKLLIDKATHSHLLKLKGESRWKMVLEACNSVTRCGEETEDGCGSRQPNKYREEPVHKIYAEWRDLEIPEGVQRPEGMDEDGNLEMPLEPELVHRLLRRISDEDVEFMGFSRHWCRPDWLMCTVLPIPPPQVRPSVTQDNNQRAEDDLTTKLIDIIKANTMVKKKISEDPKKKAIDEWTNLLQYHVATLVDNSIPGVSPAAQRSGRLLKSLQQRLGSKEGRIRSNLQGKRVEFSARSVITPDPNISVKELGVPQKIAMNLTYPEKVTSFNLGKLYKLVQNGPDVYPGAKTIQRADGRTISLKHVNTKTLELFEGDVVNRHLMDGDIVLFNRQPSLHRMSMMGHIAKILPYNTFRLNVFVTAPYNADFDGDEMNLHAPQSIEAATELRKIAAVPLQIVSPRESVPIVSVVQDTLVGANRFTRPNVLFTRKEAMNLLVHAKRWDGKLPPPVTNDPQPMWSGQQLLSTLLPPVTLRMKNNSDDLVEILNGAILRGILDKKVFSKQLLHIIYNDYGPEITVDFLDSLQAMIANFLMNDGFSVGISDLIADSATLESIDEAISKLVKTVEDQILQLHTGLFENSSGRSNQEEFEAKIMGTLNKAVGEAGKIGLSSLAATNRMTNMVKAGSKGSDVNVSQMIAVLGQQAIEGKRVPNGFQHRTLPHYKRFDDSAQARGFIASSYVKGLQPDEMFFHAMSGREGLIDTAVKTADTGYLQRKIRVALEDLITQHDGSVRDAAGNIVQMSYGEDGANATKLEEQDLPIGTFNDEKMATEYAADGSAQAAAYLEAAKGDRRMLVENIYRGRQGGLVRYPVHLQRLLYAIAHGFNLKENEGTLTADEAFAAQHVLLQRTHPNNKLWAALVRYYLRPVNLKKIGMTKVAMDAFVQQAVLKHWKSWVEPGQPVGVIAAQSIGEPATQMTLNTFHLAGVAAKSNMTRGVPRLNELLKATKNPKATELSIPLRRDLRDKKEEARRVAQDLEFTLLKDLVTNAFIYYDPRDSATLIKEDADWLAYLAAFEMAESVTTAPKQPDDPLAAEAGAASTAPVSAVEEMDVSSPSSSPLILRFELDRERMFAKDITMDDIAFLLKSKFGATIQTLYTDYNATRLVFRIRLNQTESAIDDLNTLKTIQNKILTATAVRGIPGLRSVNYLKNSDSLEYMDGAYKKVDQYILYSDGTNFLEVITHPDVDATRIVSSDVHDMFNNLGIEALRATLYKEIDTLFKESGSSVNYRHVGLLLDKMCHKGKVMSVDRYGINKNDIGPLAKMSFEQAGNIALRAAMFAECDPVLGVSANVMLGAPIRAGTAFSSILFDEVAAGKLAETTPEQVVGTSAAVGPGTFTEDELDDALYGEEEDDECAPKELNLRVPLPSARGGAALGHVEEELDEDFEMTIVE